MSISQRPRVDVKPVISLDGDISHCRISVGDMAFDAHLNQGSADLIEMILDATDVRLSVNEVMIVTRASRAQMVREASRIRETLASRPYGIVADVGPGMTLWQRRSGNLVWVDYIELGISEASEVCPGGISEVGEIDTHELYEIAHCMRTWLREPKFTEVDVDWLQAVESNIISAPSPELQPFTLVKVREDYRTLHGELIACAGAVGIIRSYDQDRRGVDFGKNETGAYVATDACGRKFHSIPDHFLEHIYPA